MNLHEIFNSFVSDTLGTSGSVGSIALFRPEMVVCATIFVMLLARLFKGLDRLHSFYFALVGVIVALVVSFPQLLGWENTAAVERQEIFTGLLVYDSLTIFFRRLLLVFAILFLVLTKVTGVPDSDDSPDFYTLTLGSILGMMLMASANHLMIVFLAVEMASVPAYVLAGILKGRRRSSEAALKFAVYGAGAAGIMLYGISLIAGLVGSCHLPTITIRIAEAMPAGTMAETFGGGSLIVLSLAGLMLMVGMAFKLSAVPFHFWAPDVFEGAAAEVGAFLSVASKAAALALLVRLAVGFGTLPAELAEPEDTTYASAGVFNVADVEEEAVEEEADGDEVVVEEESVDAEATVEGDDAAAEQAAIEDDGLATVRTFIVRLIAILAAVTATFGNLAAYGQSNIKRMLAYSTIAHAGYMMMPVAAALAVFGESTLDARYAISSVVFYVTLYVFMNVGAFAIVAFLRNAYATESIEDYGGLISQCPVTVVCFSLILFSLIGLPPLAGFAAKYVIFLALVRAGDPLMITLLVVAGLNTAISLVYYLRVVKVMTIDAEPETRLPASVPFFSVTYAVAITIPVLVFGVFFELPSVWAKAAAEHLF